MLIENIGQTTLINNIVRIETFKVIPGGTQELSGVLEIPANIAGPIIDGLVASIQELESKLKESIETSSDSKDLEKETNKKKK
jgi:hypothetical protein